MCDVTIQEEKISQKTVSFFQHMFGSNMLHNRHKEITHCYSFMLFIYEIYNFSKHVVKPIFQ